MESSDSPVSVDDAEIFTSPFSSFRRTARERSSANCATRRIAELRSELFRVMLLLLSLGRTASKLGNWPVSWRQVSRRDPMRKKRVESSLANSTVSASAESSSDLSSSIAFFGTSVFISPETPSNFSTPASAVSQPVTVGSHHGDGLGLEQH